MVVRMPRPWDECSAKQREARAILALTSFEDFVRQGWEVTDPGVPLLLNWHMTLLCKEIQRVADGVFRRRRGEMAPPSEYPTRLVIEIPPGMAKSRVVSVMLPCWMWLHSPRERFLCTSANLANVERDAGAARSVLQSEWYRHLVAYAARTGQTPYWTLDADGKDVAGASRRSPPRNALDNYENSAGGFRQSRPMGAGFTGARGTFRIVDDPHNATDVEGLPEQVDRRLERSWRKVSKEMVNRCTSIMDPEIIIQQRLHVDDCAGRAKSLGYRCITLPMDYDPDRDDLHPDDPRTEPGELLHPDLYGEDWRDELRAKMGEAAYQAQYNQIVTPSTGGMFPAEWFEGITYTEHPKAIAGRCDKVLTSTDCANKPGRKNDRTAIGVWGVMGPRLYLLDLVVGRMEFPELQDAWRAVLARWPEASEHLVEDKAAGTQLIQTEARRVAGVVPVDPGKAHDATSNKSRDKGTRAGFTQTAMRAGNIRIPRSDFVPTVGEWVAEHRAFPGTHDDIVDMTSQVTERHLVPSRYDAAKSAESANMVLDAIASDGGIPW